MKERWPVNAVHMNYEILLLARLTSFLPRKSNAQLAGLILGQIHHWTEKNSSQMSRVCPPVGVGAGRGVGGFGIEWYIIIKYKEKNLDIPNLIRATIFCPLSRFNCIYMHWKLTKIDQACLIDMARVFAFLWTDTKSRPMTLPTLPPPPQKRIMNNDDGELYCIKPFVRWRHFTTMTRILFLFPLHLNFLIPVRFE